MNIGPYLKKIRLEKDYNLSDVASRVNISASLLSQIENGKATPSLQSLEGLLSFYSINFSDFFKQVEQKRYIFVKKNETETLKNIEQGYTITLLASKLQNNALESFIIVLQPDAWISTAVLSHEINGERIILILEGAIDMIIDDTNSFIMQEGDSINFKSHVSCIIKNHSGAESKFLLSGHPPILL